MTYSGTLKSNRYLNSGTILYVAPTMNEQKNNNGVFHDRYSYYTEFYQIALLLNTNKKNIFFTQYLPSA